MVEPTAPGAGLRPGGDDAERPWQLGPYRILERLGQGGMGEVFLAERREPVPQRVALKVIRADRLDRTYRARFEMEQAALARMDHPNIARLFDAGQDGEQAWFAMEYVPGLPLSEYCQKHRLPLDQRLALFLQLCDGVNHAHMKGILHRDLKPGNILVREVDGRPVAKVIDFGLAQPVDPLQIRATLHEGLRQIVGTFAYMSPEQAQRTEGDLDTRTDVYSLGVVLFELLVGELPIDLDEVQRMGPAWFGAFLQGHEPPKPSTKLSQLGERLSSTAAERGVTPQRLQAFVRGELDWVTTKALARDRQRRYGSVRDFARDVERFLRHEPVEAGPPSAWYRTRKWLQRHARAVAAVAGAALVLVAVWSWTRALGEQVQAAEGRLDLVARVALLHELVRAGEEPLPAWPENAPLFTDWLQQVEDSLTFLPTIASAAEELRAKSDAAGPDDPLARSHADTLGRWTTAAQQLRRLQPRVERRRERALTLADRTVRRCQAEWDRCLQELAADGRFPAPPTTPLLGMVPLGKNAAGLQEFYLLDSGADAKLPERRPDGGFDIGFRTGLIFVLLPGGRIEIPAAGAIQPAEVVELEPYLLSKYEMTQAQWVRLRMDESLAAEALHLQNPANEPAWLQRVGFGPAEPRAREGEAGESAVTWVHPVQQVSWFEAKRLLACHGLNLPTRAQWLMAAGGGLQPSLDFDWIAREPHRYANIRDYPTRPGEEALPDWATLDGFVYSSPVGALLPSPLGFHDVFGNVAELCEDIYTEPGAEPTAAAGRRRTHVGFAFASTWPPDFVWRSAQTPAGNVSAAVGVRPCLLLESAPRSVRR